MTVNEIEQRIAALRARPLLLVCRTPKGEVCSMSVRECAETGSAFLHIAADELDELLEQELGREKRRDRSDRVSPD